MSDLNMTISKYPLDGSFIFSGTLKVAIYESNNPAAEVANQTFSAPHTASRAITFTNVDNVTYIVKVFADAAEIASWSQHPLSSSVSMKLPIFFRIGDGLANTPAAGTNLYSNSELVGWDYWVERRSIGGMLDENYAGTVEITKDLVAGGFTLSQAGDVFNDGEVFAVHFLPKIASTNTGGSVAGKWFDGFVALTADTVYSSAHLRKLIKLRPSGSSIKYTLPDGLSFPSGYPVCIQTFGGSAAYTVQCAGSDTIEVAGAGMPSLSLNQNEFALLVFDGTKWQIAARASTAAITSSDSPDLNDSATLATTKATKTLADRIKILGSGVYTIGDIPGSDTTYTITHGLGISGSYIVLGSFKSKSTLPERDNTIGWAFFNATANSFAITVQEINHETQNVDFCWIAVKV